MNRRHFLATTAALAGTSVAHGRALAVSPADRTAFVVAARACQRAADVCLQHGPSDHTHTIAQLRVVLAGVPVLAAAPDEVCFDMLASLSARVCEQAALELASHDRCAALVSECLKTACAARRLS
ncbi:MAG: hypothetical protein ACI8S6_004592 [Myxococcota bacterium]|jgi:hypothetical protein